MRYRIYSCLAACIVVILFVAPKMPYVGLAQGPTPPAGITIIGNEAIPQDYPTDTFPIDAMANAREYRLFTGMYKIIAAKQAGTPRSGMKHLVAFIGTGIDDNIPDLAGRVVHRQTFGGATLDPLQSTHETAMASIVFAHAGDELWTAPNYPNVGAGIAGPLGIFPEDSYIVDLVIPIENERYRGSRVAEALRYFHDLQLPGYQKDVVNCSFNCTFDPALKPAIVTLATDGVLMSCSAGQNENNGVGGEVGAGGPWPAGFSGDPDCPNVIAVTAVDPNNLTFYGSKVQFVGPLISPADGTSFVGGGKGIAGPGTSGPAAWITGYLEALVVYADVSTYAALAKLRAGCIAVPPRPDSKPWSQYGKPQLGQAFDVQVTVPTISTVFKRSKKELVIQGAHLINCTVLVNGVDKTSKVDASQSSDTQLVLFGKPAKLGLKDTNTVRVITADGLPSNTFTFML